ncbi:MAG: GAF domain-containing protein [Dehalococcoidia bacterium]
MARINAAANGPGVYEALAQGLVEELGIAMAAVWVFDPAADALNLRATAGIHGYHERAPSRLSPRDLSATIVRVAMTGASEVIDEIGPGDEFKDPAWLRREGIHAYAGLPLMLGDRGCGAMSVFYREPWPVGLLDALRALSQQAALAIEHARLIEESQTLQAIAAEVAATRDPEELLAGLVRRAGRGCVRRLVAGRATGHTADRGLRRVLQAVPPDHLLAGGRFDLADV